MSLNELMMALKEACLFDASLTPKEVTTFFVMVNADDELYAAKGQQNGSAELDFQEFLEVTCRICREKVPDAQALGEPFERTLDPWLGLVYLPSLRNAGKNAVIESSKSVSSPRIQRKATVKMIIEEEGDGPDFG